MKNIKFRTIREVIKLARDKCPNYHNASCLPLSGACAMETSTITISEGRIPCRYFETGVLPMKPELEAQYTSNVKRLKQCTECMKPFLATNNRQSFCADCTKARRKKMEAKRQRERYAKAG